MATAALLLLRATAAAAAPSSFCDDDGWAEVWADHFNGTALDTTSWTVRDDASTFHTDDLGGRPFATGDVIVAIGPDRCLDALADLATD